MNNKYDIGWVQRAMIASNDNLVDRGKNEVKKKFTGAENDIIDIKPKAQLGQKMIFHNIDIGLIFH